MRQSLGVWAWTWVWLWAAVGVTRGVAAAGQGGGGGINRDEAGVLRSILFGMESPVLYSTSGGHATDWGARRTYHRIYRNSNTDRRTQEGTLRDATPRRTHHRTSQDQTHRRSSQDFRTRHRITDASTEPHRIPHRATQDYRIQQRATGGSTIPKRTPHRDVEEDYGTRHRASEDSTVPHRTNHWTPEGDGTQHRTSHVSDPHRTQHRTSQHSDPNRTQHRTSHVSDPHRTQHRTSQHSDPHRSQHRTSHVSDPHRTQHRTSQHSDPHRTHHRTHTHTQSSWSGGRDGGEEDWSGAEERRQPTPGEHQSLTNLASPARTQGREGDPAALSPHTTTTPRPAPSRVNPWASTRDLASGPQSPAPHGDETPRLRAGVYERGDARGEYGEFSGTLSHRDDSEALGNSFRDGGNSRNGGAPREEEWETRLTATDSSRNSGDTSRGVAEYGIHNNPQGFVAPLGPTPAAPPHTRHRPHTDSAAAPAHSDGEASGDQTTQGRDTYPGGTPGHTRVSQDTPDLRNNTTADATEPRRELCCGSVVPLDLSHVLSTGEFNRVAPVGSVKVVAVPPPDTDTYRPGKVKDLNVSPVDAATMALTWTTPGDDLDDGTVTSYTLRLSTTVSDLQESQFDRAPSATLLDARVLLTTAGVYQPAGTRVEVRVPFPTWLQQGRVYYLALRAYDDHGNQSPVSNMARLFLPRTSHRHDAVRATRVDSPTVRTEEDRGTRLPVSDRPVISWVVRGNEARESTRPDGEDGRHPGQQPQDPSSRLPTDTERRSYPTEPPPAASTSPVPGPSEASPIEVGEGGDDEATSGAEATPTDEPEGGRGRRRNNRKNKKGRKNKRKKNKRKGGKNKRRRGGGERRRQEEEEEEGDETERNNNNTLFDPSVFNSLIRDINEEMNRWLIP